MKECEWTIPEMQTALVLIRHLIPKCELRRIIGEIMEEGWSVMSTHEGAIVFQTDDVSMLRKVVGEGGFEWH